MTRRPAAPHTKPPQAMKPQNQYRGEQRAKMKLLEKALSLQHRLFSLLAFKRGARRMLRFLKLALMLLPLLAVLWYVGLYALEKAYGLSIDHISYKSLRGIISKDQAMRILGIEGSVNMATLNTETFKARLEQSPAIRSASIRAELPDTLYIEVEERIPIVYVEKASGAHTGKRTRYYMDPEGVLFPVQAEYHSRFLGVPTWYLLPGDVAELREGVQIEPQRMRPIAELIAASNAYDPVEVPRILEIFRPKDWQIRLVLETGAEVLMEVRHVKDQMERLAMVLEHARATGRELRSVNVIPSINPVAVFAEPTAPAPPPPPAAAPAPRAPARATTTPRPAAPTGSRRK